MKRKIFAAFLAAIMYVSCFGVINSSAATMLDKATIVELEEQLLGEESKKETVYYAIEVPDAGELSVYFGELPYYVDVFAYNSKGVSVESKLNKKPASLTFNVKKGTYIVEVKWGLTGDTYNVLPVFAAEKQPELIVTMPLTVGKTFSLSASLANIEETITWKSSKNSVATVSSKGKIKGVSKGYATIIASTKSGLEFKVRVKVSE